MPPATPKLTNAELTQCEGDRVSPYFATLCRCAEVTGARRTVEMIQTGGPVTPYSVVGRKRVKTRSPAREMPILTPRRAHALELVGESCSLSGDSSPRKLFVRSFGSMWLTLA